MAGPPCAEVWVNDGARAMAIAIAIAIAWRGRPEGVLSRGPSRKKPSYAGSRIDTVYRTARQVWRPTGDVGTGAWRCSRLEERITPRTDKSARHVEGRIRRCVGLASCEQGRGPLKRGRGRSCALALSCPHVRPQSHQGQREVDSQGQSQRQRQGQSPRQRQRQRKAAWIPG